MLLTMNVSNSEITLGAWENSALSFRTAVHTNPAKSADEYAAQFDAMLRLYQKAPQEISGMILSCVVPALLDTLRRALAKIFAGRIYVVGPGLKTGLPIRTDDPGQVGSDLVCCAVAALARRTPLPCLLIGMDTAVSMTLLDRSGALAGGAIAPGLKIGADALCARTAQLPQIDLAAPVTAVVGTSSSACMQAGIVLGAASMLDGMIDRFSEAASAPVTCLATGDVAPVVLRHCVHTIAWHENLVHEGLYQLYLKNTK